MRVSRRKKTDFNVNVDEVNNVTNALANEAANGPVIIERKEGSDLVVMTVEQLLEITASDEPSRELFASAIGGRGNQAIGGRGNQMIV